MTGLNSDLCCVESVRNVVNPALFSFCYVNVSKTNGDEEEYV